MVSVTFFKVGGKLGFVQGVCLQTFPFKGAYSLYVCLSVIAYISWIFCQRGFCFSSCMSVVSPNKKLLKPPRN